MADFRFEGTTMAGRAVKGIVKADTFSEAKQKVRQLAEQHRVKVSKIRKRKVFVYSVQRNGEKAVKGEQKAFTKEEVRQALEKLGYKIVRIEPRWFSFNLKPPVTDVVTFVRVSANLLREKLPFNEVLQLVMNDTQNAALRETLREINNDLRQGKDSEEAFMKQEKVLGRFTARMLGLASKSGTMADMYESAAKFMERNVEFKRSLRSALIMPFFTMLVLLGAIIYYVGYIFPATAKLIAKLGSKLPPMTAATLKISGFLTDHILLLSGSVLLIASGIIYFLQTPRGKYWKDRYIISVPLLGGLIHKTIIEIFCRVFYALYSGAGENIEAIRLAAEACGNRYVEHQIKTVAIPMMLSEGKGLVEGLEASGVFTRTALARFRSGAETGTVKNTSLQIANYYEKETVYKLKNAVESIQVVLALVITIVITGLTLLSSEAAMVSPKAPF